MFDLVAKKKRVVQIVLGIVILPFAFFGIDFYFRGVDVKDQVAMVADQAITSNEYTNALRERQDQLRQMMQGKVNSDLLNGPEIKNQVVEQLIEQRLVIAEATKARVGISDHHLQQLIHDIPAFKDDSTGKFVPERYKRLLDVRGMSIGAFEARFRQDALFSQSRESVAGTHFLPKTITERLAKIRGQQREVSQSIISPAQYLPQVKLEANEVKQYYDKNPTAYTLPERARVEYVVLSMETLIKSTTATEEDIQKYYKENVGRYERAEERHARHILISLDAKASVEDKAKAKVGAEQLLAQAKQNSAGFAELAKKSSQDLGSASEGGDLGFFARGNKAKPFDDAVFGMKSGEIVGPVETQYGFHIIKLEEIKAAERKSLEEVRAQIAEDVKRNAVGRLYAEKAEQLSNLVYDQSDSLKPAADALKLTVEQSGWITKDRADPATLNNEKLLKGLFSEEAVKYKRNTEAIEVSPNTLVAARVIEHVPAARQPFEAVQELITEQLKATKATELAKKDGEDKIARLKKGEVISMQWSPDQTVSREKPEGLSAEAAQTVFQADVSKLPAYAGFSAPDGRYVIFRIGKVREATATNADQDKELAKQISTLLGREVYGARLKSLRDKNKVIINKDRLEKS